MYQRHSDFMQVRLWASAIFILLITFFAIDASGQDVEKSIPGNWKMVSNGDGFLEATLLIDPDHNYKLNRKWPDGSTAEVKGMYELDPGTKPATLRLCMGDCNAAGSEWTSMYCIVRLGGNGLLEMVISDSGEFPNKFPGDQSSKGMYVFSRIE